MFFPVPGGLSKGSCRTAVVLQGRPMWARHERRLKRIQEVERNTSFERLVCPFLSFALLKCGCLFFHLKEDHRCKGVDIKVGHDFAPVSYAWSLRTLEPGSGRCCLYPSAKMSRVAPLDRVCQRFAIDSGVNSPKFHAFLKKPLGETGEWKEG